jgi:hypothetical protein
MNAVKLLAMALLTAGCTSLTPLSGRGIDITAEVMTRYNIPLNFTPWRGR